MPHSFHANLLHCVFTTKARAALIPPGHHPALARYLATIARMERATLLESGGIADHVHVLLYLPAHLSLGSLMSKLKAHSSRWMKDVSPNFAWQEGYGAFSVSPSRVNAVRSYIRNQEQHHNGRAFDEEFADLLRAAGMDAPGEDRQRPA